MNSPAFAPKRFRHPTADGAPGAALSGGHERDESDSSDKYWDVPVPPPPISHGSMYQQANISAPQVDVAGAMGSRGPPLADDLGFDKLSIGARAKSPASGALGGGGASSSAAAAAVERANVAYATQEIYQSAAEVAPESSLKAIAAEVDQTAAELRSDSQQQPQHSSHVHPQYQGGHTASYNDGSSAHMMQSATYDPSSQYGGGAQGAGGGYDPSLYSQGQQSWYGADGQYYDDGQQAQQQYSYGAYPAHHQQSGGYFAGANDAMASSSSSHQVGPYRTTTPGYPYMNNAQGYGMDYSGNQSATGASNSLYPGYGPQEQLGRNPSAGTTGSGPYMPALARQGTQLSMASLQSTNSAAVRRRSSKDVGIKAAQQSLPFNKSFVEEYRQRMKKDPDPEAQFAFARYLIEAAKKINDPKDGPKQARKYRDNLLGESLKLIKRLATTGMGLGKPPYAEAQFFLANCFGNGSLGLQVDHEKAYNLYVQASKQNHAAATYRTAVCNEVGAGTRRDHHRAVLFYRKASALGDTAGMYKLGMILLNGLLGQPRNIREAVVWLKRAAGQADDDNPHALHELGLLYEKANNNIVPHDEGHARELFTQAAQLGYAPSQFKLGSAYEYGTLTCPVDPRRSIAWYTKAAGKNDGESELALSGWYLTGSEGVLKQSDSEAYLWARRAATKGIPKAEYAVGYYSEVGIGVESNIEEAKRWYMRAAAQGNKRAMMRLTELKQQKDGRGGRRGARPTRKDAESECVIA